MLKTTTTKPTLTLRCGTCGGRLAGVHVRNNRPIAEVTEDGWAIRRNHDGKPKITLQRRMTSTWDLHNEFPERTMVQASCKCGGRTVSLADVLTMFLRGEAGTVISREPLIAH